MRSLCSPLFHAALRIYGFQRSCIANRHAGGITAAQIANHRYLFFMIYTNRLEGACINASKTGLAFVLIDKNASGLFVSLECVVVTRLDAFAALALVADDDTFI
jgi:hypothetical protein